MKPYPSPQYTATGVTAALLLLHSCTNSDGPLAMQGDSKQRAPEQSGSVALRHTPAPLTPLPAASPQATLTTVVRENHEASQRQEKVLEEMRDNRMKEIDTLQGAIRKVRLGQGKVKKGVIEAVSQELANLKTALSGIAAGQGAAQAKKLEGLSKRYEALLAQLAQDKATLHEILTNISSKIPSKVLTAADIMALLQADRMEQEAAVLAQLQKDLDALMPKQRALYGSEAYVTVQPFLLGDKPWSIAQSYIQLAIIEKEKKKAEEKQDATRDQLIESYETIYASKKNIELKAIPDLFKKSRKVLLIGRAGIGKTTVCKKLAHMWANKEWGEAFEAVYVLPVRALNNYKGQGLLRQDLVWAMARECFSDGKHLDQEALEKRTICIKEQFKKHGDKILLILDGLDEANNTAKLLLNQAKHKEKYGHAAQLWVSRPYGVNGEDRKGAIEIENIGFNSDQVTKYAEEYFRVEGGQGDVKQSAAASGLLDYLQQHPDVRGTAHVPINLQILCNLWKEDGGRAVREAGGSLTKLYDRMAEKIWRRYAHECDKEDGRSINVDGQLVYIRDDQEKLAQLLERIALRGFQENERQILIAESLVQSQIEAVCKARKCNDRQQRRSLRALLKQSGFLRSTEDGSKSEFLHLTFQEYFAGRALARQFLSATESKQASAFLATNQYKSETRVTLSFMAGEVYQQAGLEGLRALLNALNAAPREVLGLQHLLLQVRCVEQCLAVAQDKGARAEILHHVTNLRKDFHAFLQSGWKEVNQAPGDLWGSPRWRSPREELNILHATLFSSLARLPFWAKANGVVAFYGQSLKDNKDAGIYRTAASSLRASGLQKISLDWDDWFEKSKAAAVRRVAVYALGRLCFKESIPYLGAALKKDRDVEVRRNAVFALG